MLGPQPEAALDVLAPTDLQVPSGSWVKLVYAPGAAPILSVKLQELFGLADTPRVAEGRVPVMLHLLSPARRPIQVTQDLHGFWERYPQVKKELRGRYPKHPWPDDPWSCAPTAGPSLSFGLRRGAQCEAGHAAFHIEGSRLTPTGRCRCDPRPRSSQKETSQLRVTSGRRFRSTVMSNAEQGNVLHIGLHEKTTKSKSALQPHELMDELKHLTVEQLRPLLRQLFDSVDDTLFELADKAENNSIQSLYFDAMREVRIKREKVEGTFTQRVADTFAKFPESAPECGSVRVAEEDSEPVFELLDDDELEESLAVGTMTAKARAQFGQPLQALERRLGHLFKGRVIDELSNPLGPAAICGAFRSAMQLVEVDIKTRLILYKLFDRHVMQRLSPLYTEANTLLIDAGVLPGLKLTTRRRHAAVALGPSVPGAQERRNAAYGPAESEDEALEMPAHSLQQILSLLAVRRGGGFGPAMVSAADAIPLQVQGIGSGSAGSVEGAFLSTQELLTALSLMQSSTEPVTLATVDGNRVASAQSLRNSVLGEFTRVSGSGQPQAINRLDDSIIDIVGMLFDFILDDAGLAPVVKALIARLQIPMLKLALIDRDFFSRRGHPARRLLNELANAGIELGGEEKPEDTRLFAQIERTVNRILEEFNDDVSLFVVLLEEFITFMETEKKYFGVIEQRTHLASQGRERLEMAKLTASAEIHARLAVRRRPPPEVVQEILRDAWQDVLVHIYLREGVDSEAWRNALLTMETLLWSVEPKRTDAERQRLVRTIPKLLNELRGGLARMSYPFEEMERQFKRLEASHVASLHASDASDAEEEIDAAPQTQATIESTAGGVDVERPDDAASEAADTAEADAASAAGTDEVAAELESVGIGTWFDLSAVDGTSVRAKLSWISEITSKCLFVNRRGLKVTEKTLQDLAAEMRAGTAVVVQDGPMFDRALNAVVSALK